MVHQVVWTENALYEYQHIVYYLLTSWSIKIAEEFSDNVQKRLNILAVHPHIGTVSEKNSEVRSILLTKHNWLYYTLQENTIIILSIFDLRQGETKNKF